MQESGSEESRMKKETQMTAKEYLLQIHDLDTEIRQDIQELERLETEAENVKAIRYDQDRVDASPEGDALMNAVIKIIEYKERIGEKKLILIAKRLEIINQIQELENKAYSDLLFRRYVNQESLQSIAHNYGRKKKTIDNMHGRALAAFSDQFFEK